MAHFGTQHGHGFGLASSAWVAFALLTLLAGEACGNSHGASVCGDGVCDLSESCASDCASCDGTGPCVECGGTSPSCDGVCEFDDMGFCGCSSDCAATCDVVGVLAPCRGTGCPYLLDATVSCIDPGFGLHVAPGVGDAALLSFTTNGGSFKTWLATIAPADVAVRSLPWVTPSALVMSGADGTASILVGELPGVGLGYFASTATPLSDVEPVSAPPGSSDFYLPIDGRFDAAGAAHALYRLGSGEVFVAQRGAAGWTSQMLGSGPRIFVPAGQALAFDSSGAAVVISWKQGASGYDLMRYDSDGIGSPLLQGLPIPYGSTDAADAAPDGTANTTVAFQAGDGIHLAWPSGASYRDMLLPRTEPAPAAMGCPAPDAPCECFTSPTLCNETAPAAPVAGAFALVRAANALWVIWVEAHVDRDLSITGVAGGVCSCERTELADRSTYDLIVAQVFDPLVLDWNEALRIPLSAEPTELHATARGSRLYIAADQDAAAALSARVFVLDISVLAVGVATGI